MAVWVEDGLIKEKEIRGEKESCGSLLMVLRVFKSTIQT